MITVTKNVSKLEHIRPETLVFIKSRQWFLVYKLQEKYVTKF